MGLDSAFPRHVFLLFFFFFFFAFTCLGETKFTIHETNVTVPVLFCHCSCTVYHCSSTIHILKNIKNESHSTINIFKNYFATVFSVSVTISSIQTDVKGETAIGVLWNLQKQILFR